MAVGAAAFVEAAAVGAAEDLEVDAAAAVVVGAAVADFKNPTLTSRVCPRRCRFLWRACPWPPRFPS